MFFDTAIELLDRYFWWAKTVVPAELDHHVVNEIRDRLRQLNHLYDEIVRLENGLLAENEAEHGTREADENRIVMFTNLALPADPDKASEYSISPLSDAEVLRTSVEAFYYLAHRISVIVRQCGWALPQLKPLDANGVTRVRNNLIEHANRKDGIRVLSFSVSNASSTRLRPVTHSTHEAGYVDEGFVTNATEFRDGMVAMFEATLSLP